MNIYFENVFRFKHLGMKVTNQNCIHEDKEQIKFWKCLLQFSSEYSVYWVRNLVSQIGGTIQIEGV
jgi:hypothetical protein